MVDYFLTKLLKINVNNRIPMKTSWYVIDLQLVIPKNLVISNAFTLLTVITKKTLIFFKNT